MKHVCTLLSATLIFTAAALSAEDVKPAAPPSRCILLVNAAELPAAQMEEIRNFAETDLNVPVKATELKADWATLPNQAAALLSPENKVVVVLGKTPGAIRILSAPDNGWAVVNVAPVLSLKDKQAHMLKQQAFRGIGYALGLATCLDLHCCLRISQTVLDLQDAGCNFCPLSRRDYDNLIIQKSLCPVSTDSVKPRKAKPAAPPAP